MRITHLVAGNLHAGAARGAYWLHCALLELGVESTILTDAADWQGKPGVVSVTHTKHDLRLRKWRHIRDLIPLLWYRNRKRESFATGSVGKHLWEHPAVLNADVVNLHWINHGFVSIKDIGRFQKPLVWTLRDLWPMTGGCHVPMTCERFVQTCGCCPLLRSKNPSDLSHRVFASKQRHYPKEMTVVGISRWLTEIAQASSLLGRYRSVTIPNCVNTDFFTPGDSVESRKRLGLSLNVDYVLLGAMRPEKPNKGFNEFLAAVNSSRLNFSIAVFGNITAEALSKIKKPFVSFGRIDDDDKIRDLYRAATIFLAPSLNEPFGKTLAESLACGTPVVAFNNGGPADIVVHQSNGFAATPFDPESLREGIEFTIQSERHAEMAINARRDAVEKFSFRSVATAYHRLYVEILNDTKVKPK